MEVAANGGLAELSSGRRLEPRWLSLLDLILIVAAVALIMTIPARTAGWPLFLAPPPLAYFLLVGGLTLTVRIGLVLALVVLFRRWRYGGPVRSAEWLALALASTSLLDATPNLDDAVNALYRAVGSNSLDFSVARWLLSAPAAVGVSLNLAGLVWLRRRLRAGSRAASAGMVFAIVCGLFLWFWGPCAVVKLELPSLLVSGPKGDPSTWGWWGTIVILLQQIVANAPMSLTWGLLAAATLRSWRPRSWVWTEWAAAIDALLGALLLLAIVSPQDRGDLTSLVSWFVIVGLASWWITGRVGVRRDVGILAR